MARSQARAQQLADLFNQRVKRLYPDHGGQLQLNFAPCVLYEVVDPTYPDGIAWILAEPMLEGRWMKWNNNGGHVAGDEGATGVKLADQVPQAFSHFTASVTDFGELVCDLQGVYNETDGFTLTDPAIHKSADRQRARRSTDKSVEGMVKFFATHKCNGLCRDLMLKRMEIKL